MNPTSVVTSGPQERFLGPLQYDAHTMDRTFLFVGALAGLVGVALGAFGAHFLKARLSTDMLAVYETGVRYQLIHALALLATAALAGRVSERLLTAAGWLFTTGI